MIVPAASNLTAIVASVIEKKSADDGWGAWAEIKIETAAEAKEGMRHSPGLARQQMTVFVPPALVASIIEGQKYEGGIVYRGLVSTGGFYSLQHIE
jgi:hypothetical protein